MFVGRKEERSKLSSSLHEALGGKGKVVFISGEAGLGKTTLVEQWWKEVSGDFGKNLRWDKPVFGKASCSIPVGGLNVGGLEALQPFADMLSSFCGSAANDEKRFRKITDVLMEAAPDWLNAIPVVGRIAGAGVKTYNIYKKNKEKAGTQNVAVNQQQVFQQYINFLVGLSEKESAVVIWIDDLHWADTSSLNLLFYLARQIADKPILIIITYRPEETVFMNPESCTLQKIRNEILRYDLGTNLSLTYFTPEEIVAFLQRSYTGYASNKKFEDWLLKISGGNALFITNFTKTLTEDGLIRPDGVISEDYKLVKPPETIRAVVEERIRRMDENVSELLRYATAEGEEFTSYIVAKITGKGPMEIIKVLKKAEELGIIRNSGSAEVYSKEKTTLYNFLHVLFYNALYESLNGEEKLILHRQCFEVLKPEWEKNKQNILLSTKLLAHAEKCEEYYTAGEIGISTAKFLWQKFAKDEALEILRKILNEYPEQIKASGRDMFENEYKPKILGEAKYFYAEVLSRTGNFKEAFEAYKDAAETFEETGNAERRIYSLNGVAFILIRFNRQRESLEYAKFAYKLSEEINFLGGKLFSLNHIADANWGLGNTEEATKIFEQCIELNKDTDDKLTQSYLLSALGSLYSYAGDKVKAVECLMQSIDIAKEINSIKNEANSLGILALIKAERSEFSEALEMLDKVLEVQVMSGDRNAEAWTLNKIGQIQSDIKDFTPAIKNLEASRVIFEEINNPGEITKSLFYLGNVYRLAGKYEESINVLKKSLEISENFEHKLLKGLILGEISYTEEKLGNIDNAIRNMEEALSILKALNYEQVPEYEKELSRMKLLLK